jgi:hypothetical protein
VNIRIDHLGRVQGRALRGILRSTIAFAYAATVALVASATSADASAREINSAWSWGFGDSLWTNNGLWRARTLSPPVDGWSPGCFVNCGPAFGTYVVRRTELLSSSAGDVAVNRVVDSTGRPLGVSGMIVTERLEPDGFGAGSGFLMDWVVAGERVLDSNGAHSWSLLSPDISLGAHWLPIELFRFEGSSFSMDFAASAPAGASATPEASTWAMMLIGFAGLGVAGYRSSRNHRRAIQFPKRMYA